MKLLLDEMISSKVAEGLRRLGLAAVALVETASAGTGVPDERLLEWATERGETVVTYNVRDFVHLAREWARSGRRHAGLVLVSSRTISPGDPGALQRSLAAWVQGHAAESFGGIDFLQRAQ